MSANRGVKAATELQRFAEAMFLERLWFVWDQAEGNETPNKPTLWGACPWQPDAVKASQRARVAAKRRLTISFRRPLV